PEQSPTPVEGFGECPGKCVRLLRGEEIDLAAVPHTHPAHPGSNQVVDLSGEARPVDVSCGVEGGDHNRDDAVNGGELPSHGCVLSSRGSSCRVGRTSSTAGLSSIPNPGRSSAVTG